jgi:hypothetical protein
VEAAACLQGLFVQHHHHLGLPLCAAAERSGPAARGIQPGVPDCEYWQTLLYTVVDVNRAGRIAASVLYRCHSANTNVLLESVGVTSDRCCMI